MMQAGKNRVAVILNEFYNSEANYNDFTIKFDPAYRPTHHIKTCAKIKATPMAVSKGAEGFLEALKSADRVYFDYKALEEDEYVLDEDDNRVYFVQMGLIFCCVDKDGNVTPNVNLTICEPFYGFGYEKVDMPDGGQVYAKQNSLGIITDTNPDPDERIAVVKYPDLDSELKEGDLVFREPKTNYEYEIEGEKLYMVPTSLILLKYKGDQMTHKIVDDVRDEYNGINLADDPTKVSELFEQSSGDKFFT